MTDNSNKSPKPSIWLYLIGVLFVGSYTQYFEPLFSGNLIKPESSSAVTIISPIFGAMYWQYLGRKRWHGALIFFGTACAIFFLSAFLGLVRP